MIEYQYLNIRCDNCDTPYEIEWDIDSPQTPLTCPFCGHELEDDVFIDEEDKAIGIDYSLNSPAICIASGDMSFKNCKFHFLSSKKKYIGKFDNILGTEYPEWSDPIERFSNISKWVYLSLRSYGDMELFNGKTVVHIEGYSYGSKGRQYFK